MPERLFLFLQFEFPWELGPPDGRYLLRASAGAEPERVIVLGTLGASRRGSARAGSWGGVGRQRRRPTPAKPLPEPIPVATARATIVDPIPLSAARQAQAWLSDLDAEREALAAVAVLNRVLHFHRIASADPYIHELSPAQALVIRAGWGEGEQVADGRWLHAQEFPWRGRGSGGRRRGRDRTAALRPQERLAELLSARGAPLLCEEATLRARLDLDHGRLALAAIELDAAYAAALRELSAEGRQDLAIRIAELGKLRPGVAAQARAALEGPGASAAASAHADAGASASGQAGAAAAGAGEAGRGDRSSPRADEEVLRNALGRLEAALRARTAPGFRLT